MAEFSESGRCESPSDLQCDQKNIRRRVYDALNVLMAMNIISKEKKEIKWLGLPTNSLQVRVGYHYRFAEPSSTQCWVYSTIPPKQLGVTCIGFGV